MRKILLPIIAFVAMSFAQLSVLPQPNATVLEFIPSDIKIATVQNEFGTFAALDFDNAQFEALAGEIQLPVFVAPLGVPEGEITVTFDVQWGQSLHLDNPLRFADSVFWEKGDVKSQAVPPKQNSIATIDAQKACEIVQFKNYRSQRVAKVVFRPVRYDTRTQTITCAKKITATVQYPKRSGTFVNEGNFEKALAASIVNYEQAKNFRMRRTMIDAPANPFGNSNTWLRFALTEGGIYAFTRNTLSAAGLSGNFDPSTIRFFHTGAGMLNPNMPRTIQTFSQAAAMFIGNGNNAFEDGETLLVYMPAPEWWTTVSGLPVWNSSLFCDSMSLWVSVGGDFAESATRVNTLLLASAETTITTGWHFVHYGQNLQFDEYDANEWYWQLVNTTAGLYITDSRISTAQIPNGRIWVSSTPRSPDTLVLNSRGYQTVGSSAWVENLRSGSNQLLIGFDPATQIYLKGVNAQYLINLAPQSGVLRFFENMLDATRVYGFALSSLSPAARAWDVTDIFAPRNLPVSTSSAFVDSGGMREYFVFDGSAIRPLPTPHSESNFSLWAQDVDSFEYLILADTSIFNTEALEELAREKSLVPKTIDVQEIMRQFGFGRYDPSALRNFVAYVYAASAGRAPSYIVLVGDGHYDFRHVLTDAPVYFPPAFTIGIHTDAFYGTFYGNETYYDTLELPVGRIPARTQAEFDDMVAKFSDYATCAPKDEWRMRCLLAADDEWTTEGVDGLGYTVNTSELLSVVLPSRTIIDPLYLIEYPRSPSLKKPEARLAFINKFNSGAVFINWIGHGNHHLLAHEHMMNMPGDLSSYTNGEKLPLFCAFSCDVSVFWFLGDRECVTELLLRSRRNGAIAGIAATASTFASTNQIQNRLLCRALFDTTEPMPLGMALLAARVGSLADRGGSYNLFGDPAQTLAFPYPRISLTITPEIIAPGAWAQVSGTCPNPSFDGTAKIFLYAPNNTRHYSSPAPGIGDTDYIVPGMLLFVGAASVIDGHFTLNMFVPKNISAAEGYKLVAYATSNENCDNASGSFGNLHADLTFISEIIDTTGPKVSLAFDKNSFVSGGIVCSKDGTLPVTIELYDEHGISMGGRPGQGVLLQLDSDDNRVDVSQAVVFALDAPLHASIEHTFTNVTDGVHELCVQAWDNMGNASQYCAQVILQNCNAAIYNAIPYPNPFSDGVDITFALAGAGSLADVTLTVSTLSGRTIFTDSKTTNAAFDLIHWDGKGSNGEAVARGAYIFTIKAKLHAIDGTTKTEFLRGKIVKY